MMGERDMQFIFICLQDYKIIIFIEFLVGYDNRWFKMEVDLFMIRYVLFIDNINRGEN